MGEMSEICEGLKTTAVIQINHMGRSAGDMNAIKKKRKSQKKNSLHVGGVHAT